MDYENQALNIQIFLAVCSCSKAETSFNNTMSQNYKITKTIDEWFKMFKFQSGNGDANMSVVAKRFWDMVSDPRVIDKVLDTENVDYNVTMAQTTRWVFGKYISKYFRLVLKIYFPFFKKY